MDDTIRESVVALCGACADRSHPHPPPAIVNVIQVEHPRNGLIWMLADIDRSTGLADMRSAHGKRPQSEEDDGVRLIKMGDGTTIRPAVTERRSKYGNRVRVSWDRTKSVKGVELRCRVCKHQPRLKLKTLSEKATKALDAGKTHFYI